MCCWGLRIFCTLVTNLVSRTFDECIDMCSSCVHRSADKKCFEEKAAVEQSANIDDADSSQYEVVLEEANSIEYEPYFKAVDRSTAEEILLNRIDGSCLVRPFKEQNSVIKFIVTVYAQNNYFHLYIRQTSNGTFTLGQQKLREKYFPQAKDIIKFYRLNKLVCTNKTSKVSIVLVPIT